MDADVNFDGLPKLEPKRDKIVAAILLLLSEAQLTGRALSKGEIVKSLFLADDHHLSAFGRPVTFDNYVAMHKGPVGDLASDMLNDKVDWEDFDRANAPWIRGTERGLQCYKPSIVEADLSTLSRTDVASLKKAFDIVTNDGFDGVSESSHDHPAWRAAWGDGTAKAAAMDWRDFPSVDEETVLDLVSSSRPSR